MRDYTLNKILSLLAVFLCIGLTYSLFGYTTTQWQSILLCIVVFGYAHFLVGFYYQLRSFARAEQPSVRYVTFAILTALSVGIAYVLFSVFGFALSLFFGFLYFLLHGLFNEQTLIERQTGLAVPLMPLVALAIFIISLLVYSVPDETFFFDHTLSFQPLTENVVIHIFNTQLLNVDYFRTFFWFGVVVSGGLLLVAWKRYRFPRLVLTVTALILGLTAVSGIFGAPPYIYMYLFVVGYHFMTWLLFYGVEFKRRGFEPWKNFLLINVGVFGALGYALYEHWLAPTAFTSIVFDYRVFVVFTYVHITTSFMNDAWFKRLELKVFGHFLKR